MFAAGQSEQYRARMQRRKAVLDACIATADAITEMKVIKRAFQSGVSAQKGIEL